LRATLGTTKDDAPLAPDDAWRQRWPSLARLGVTGFCVPEERGGFGLRVDAAAAAAQELGIALDGSPYAGLVASAYALGRADDPAAADLLAGIVAGDRLCAFGMLDPGGAVERGGLGGSPPRVSTARVVDGAPHADALLLLQPGLDDLTLVTDPSTWTVEEPRFPFDVSRTCGDIVVDAGSGRRIPGAAMARDLYGLLLVADALGCVQRMLDRTVAYAAQRQAFGRPIGGFQAVQHRLVDHVLRARGMALVVAEAARLLVGGSPDAPRFVALAELSVSSGGPRILHDLVQLTGAIGFTWEYGLHFYERRVLSDARLAANPRAAARILADIEGWTRAC
jgi:alkylation response protein AidB-like acyl-CoA dehydrogenase